jgi:hypothetical protein
MLAILFWVFWFIGALGGSAWRYRIAPSPFIAIDFLVWLLIGALGLKVFPFTW